MKKGDVVLMVQQGIHSPRDGSMGWRDWEAFKADEMPKARAAAKRLEPGPARILKLECVYVKGDPMGESQS